MLILERSGVEPSYQNNLEETGDFLGAIALDDQTVLNLTSLEHNMGASRLSSWQLGLSGFWNLPYVYQGKMYFVNAYAGNVGGTWFKNGLDLNVGKIDLLEMSFPSHVKLNLLSSRVNNYVDVRVLSTKTYDFMDAKHQVELGVGAWMNGSWVAEFVLSG